jgi:hypothetical protein
LEVSDELGKRIESAVAKSGSDSLTVFLYRSINREIERLETDLGNCNFDLESLTGHVRRLEAGQQAIIALLDSSAKVICSLLRGGRSRL